MTIQLFADVKDKVKLWASENAPIDYTHGAPYSWWNEALKAGVCTRKEYDQARQYYGKLWTYRGD